MRTMRSGAPITARYAWLQESEMAVMEMSEAAGMWRIAPAERDPFRANTCGVGEMLLDAARRGANEVIVGLGGSATNDGGFGMARALGFRFFEWTARVERARLRFAASRTHFVAARVFSFLE